MYLLDILKVFSRGTPARLMGQCSSIGCVQAAATYVRRTLHRPPLTCLDPIHSMYNVQGTLHTCERWRKATFHSTVCTSRL
jgi:hypothetical protein